MNAKPLYTHHFISFLQQSPGIHVIAFTLFLRQLKHRDFKYDLPKI